MRLHDGCHGLQCGACQHAPQGSDRAAVARFREASFPYVLRFSGTSALRTEQGPHRCGPVLHPTRVSHRACLRSARSWRQGLAFRAVIWRQGTITGSARSTGVSISPVSSLRSTTIRALPDAPIMLIPGEVRSVQM